ncbi:MAG: DNA polymerase III subunit delta, partial [Pseudomonadota bacterium]
RKEPALVIDALKAVGFFPGPRAVLVEEAADGLTPILKSALEAWADGDAMLVVTAGSLNARSSLRKLFTEHPATKIIPIYDDPPSRATIEAELARAQLPLPDRETFQDLTTLAHALDPGDFRQVLEKLSLYTLGQDTPFDQAALEAVAPATTDAALDDAIHAAADGALDRLTPTLQRLSGQGTTAITLCIAVARHFRQLHAASADPAGPEAALSRARPPVFGPRRDAMLRQARRWGTPRLEAALSLISELDLSLRSSPQAPAMALLERAMIRLAMMTPK